MGRRSLGWVGLLLLGCGRLGWAAEAPVELEPVVVTATRGALPESKVTKAVSLLEAAGIERQHAATALEVLRTIPGVFIRRSGQPGRITSALVRGSTDKHVLVLLDGVDVSSPTLGSFDLSTLPADFLERIEVLRGAASTLYGSKAVAGVINLITKRGEGPFSASYQQEVGTLHTFRETLATQAAAGPLRYHVGLSREDSRGLSTGDALRNTHLSTAGTVQVSPSVTLDAAVHNNRSFVGIDDGPFRPDPNRYVEREHVAVSTALKAAPAQQPWESEVRFLYNEDNTRDVDRADPGKRTDRLTRSVFNTDRYGMDWVSRVSLGAAGLTTSGLELQREEAHSARFDESVDSHAWFAQHQVELTERFTMVGGVRRLNHELFGDARTTEASAVYHIPVIETMVRGGYSQGFRAPSLNDLFFPNFGNPEVQPERSRTYEVGGGRDFWGGRVGGEVTWFDTEVEDLIQAVRVSPTASRADNAATATMRGLEVEGRFEPGGGLRCAGHWAYTRTREEPLDRELVRTPKHRVGMTVDYDFLTRWRLHVSGLYLSPQEEQIASHNRQILKDYQVVDAALSFQATRHVQLYGRIENVFHQLYREVWGFSSPRTLFFVGAKVTLDWGAVEGARQFASSWWDRRGG